MAEELFEAMKRAYPEFANLLSALIVHHNCPCHIVAEPAVLAIQHHANDEAEAQYSILPMTRGKANLGDVYIRYQSPMRSAGHGTAVANPQLSVVTSEELVLIETYLHRRVDMDLILRDQVAYKIASRITEKTGLRRGPNQSLDDFLEASARQIRDTARFR